MMDPALIPADFAPYRGDYEKTAYDLRLKDGREVSGYYPNAGDFHALGAGPVCIPGARVEAFRLSRCERETVAMMLPLPGYDVPEVPA